MTVDQRTIIGITMGDPAGIGPEIIVKALAQDRPFYKHCRPVIIGDARILEYYKNSTQLNVITDVVAAQGKPGQIDILDMQNADPETFDLGEVSGIAGKASVEYIIKATELAMDNQIGAIVTGPINKESINNGGYQYAGHTELLADLTKAKDVSMMLVSSKLRVLHVSTHVSLKEAINRVKQSRISRVIRLANQACIELGIQRPRVAVAGLNPHASEHGLFGNEEAEEITPAIEECRQEGIDASGPHPPDTIFLQTVQGRYDVVIAMYHDQGHIPTKVLGFDEGVNVSVGLPIIRSSVDHGTAFDIVGQGIASETSLIEAIKVALQMIQARKNRSEVS